MEVRLQPKAEDPYKWQVLPHKAHLFEKNLSKLSTRVYMQITDGIGEFFEAIETTSTIDFRPGLNKVQLETLRSKASLVKDIVHRRIHVQLLTPRSMATRDYKMRSIILEG